MHVLRIPFGVRSYVQLGCRPRRAGGSPLQKSATIPPGRATHTVCSFARALERSSHDSQTENGPVPPLLAQEGRFNRQTAKSRHLFNPGAGKATRARGSILQEV